MDGACSWDSMWVGNLCRSQGSSGCSHSWPDPWSSAARLVEGAEHGVVWGVLPHRTCAADRLAVRPQPLSLPGATSDADLEAVLGSLPSLDAFFSTPIGARDLVSSALLPSAQKGNFRCIVQVFQHNTADAWADPGGLADAAPRKRCRLVWLEFFLFC